MTTDIAALDRLPGTEPHARAGGDSRAQCGEPPYADSGAAACTRATRRFNGWIRDSTPAAGCATRRATT